ncbi:MAG: S1C family serine protease [Anaerolineae bacterium]
MTDLESLYVKVNPSVVNIRVTSQAVNVNSSDTPVYQVGEGSGFVYDTQGHIITNNHVVAGATSVFVTFADNTTYQAKVIGTDPNSDLAVIQVQSDAAHSVPLTLGDSDKVLVGEVVVAIGNPFGLQGSMTYGIVSALGRTIPASNNTNSSNAAVYTIPDIIQTDAAINPGNSGGPLLNMQGEVIGINAAIESASNSSAGIGFTIPANIVKKVVPALIQNGKYEWPRLGITTFTVNAFVDQALGFSADQRGVMVVEVTPGSPAEKAGLQPATSTVAFEGSQLPTGGDVITAIDGTKVNQFDDLISYLARNASVGQTVNLTVLRGGKTITVPVTLDARPS